MIEVNFEVTGGSLDELEYAAAKELLAFTRNTQYNKIDYSLDVRPRTSTRGGHPNVVLWLATVRATVEEVRAPLKSSRPVKKALV